MNYSDIIRKRIMDAAALRKNLALWRFLDKKIVFTNGCFDLIHRGHVQLLMEARALGNVLIVGLNSDASMRRIKPGRPVQDEESRALIMASFDVVDGVVLFDEETPYDLIKIIEPDVLVKGDDYKIDDVVGKDIVEQRGGRVVLIPMVEGFSTSALIKKN